MPPWGVAMFLVYGHKYDLEPIKSVPISCPECHAGTMQVCRGKKKLTLYWLPTFTLEEGFFFRCPHCKSDSLYQLTPEQVAALT